jgi:hypothetical protein
MVQISDVAAGQWPSYSTLGISALCSAGAAERYRYPISWALAKASVRFLAPSLTMADDR